MVCARLARKIEPLSVTNASGGPYSCTARQRTTRKALRSCLRVTELARTVLE